jgi:hypothetical protein
MGLEQTVTFARGAVPAWAVVGDLLARRGFPVHVRMIDGELALPDELPSDAWHELRLGTPQGMVTARRLGDAVVLVTWGNAEAPLRQAWNALAWAFAEATGGRIVSPDGPQAAADFQRTADLPVSIKQAE